MRKSISSAKSSIAPCTASLVVPAHATERIQEGHITLIHLICELVERTLFPDALTA